MHSACTALAAPLPEVTCCFLPPIPFLSCRRRVPIVSMQFGPGSETMGCVRHAIYFNFLCVFFKMSALIAVFLVAYDHLV